jgi:pimeloyl-ACP methyl ester carboxylesterase
MAEATVNAWVNDVAEALAIGRAIGDRVVVIATSTGGSLAAWAATQPTLAQGLAGVVLISPNFGVQAAGAGLLTGPWGKQLAEMIVGPERGFEPANDKQAMLWTSRYPTTATVTMAGAVALARGAPLEKAAMPALFIFSDQDKVVRPEEAKAAAARWGGPVRTIIVNDSGDASDHVLAGDALSPGTTARMVADIVEWIRTLPAG